LDCIFCKIIKKEIPASIIYEDESIIVFNDINPNAPVHLLVVPKIHIASLEQVTSENSEGISKVFEVISKLSKQLDLKDGFRVVSNCGKNAKQSVAHIHFHILAGKELTCKMG